MDSDLQKYFDNYFDMFASEGWKQFVSDMSAPLGSTELQLAIQDAKNDLDLGKMKGVVSQIQNILVLEDRLREEHDRLAEDAAEENVEDTA